MPLPAAAQAVKDRLVAEGETPAAPATPVAAVPVEPVPGDKVTISRDEFNELQAARDRVAAVEGRAEAARLDLDALQTRLTELESASKGKPVATEAPASLPEFPAVEFSKEEEAEYGDSRAFIEKVVMQALAKVLPNALKAIDTKLAEVHTVASAASKGVSRVTEKTFLNKVKEKVGNFEEVVDNKHWKSFCESVQPTSGLTYAECIANNATRENLDGMVEIFNTFKKKYGVGEQVDSSGYAGATPSGLTETPAEPGGKETLKFSDRKKISEDFKFKRITFTEYEAAKAKYDLADKEGRLDYNA